MRTEKFPSKAGLKTGGTWLVCAPVVVFFAMITLTVPPGVCLAAALMVAAATGLFVAGWVARGRTDGQ